MGSDFGFSELRFSDCIFVFADFMFSYFSFPDLRLHLFGARPGRLSTSQLGNSLLAVCVAVGALRTGKEFIRGCRFPLFGFMIFIFHIFGPRFHLFGFSYFMSYFWILGFYIFRFNICGFHTFGFHIFRFPIL